MAPNTAFQILQGLETLPLRMQRHVDNTREVVAFLAAQDMVASVSYPELPDHPGSCACEGTACRKARALSSASTCAAAGQPGRALIESLELFSHLANVGDAKSLVIHPASTTHHRMDEAALAAAGIGEGLVRLSVGLEDPADLIADLKSGLKRAAREVG